MVWTRSTSDARRRSTPWPRFLLWLLLISTPALAGQNHPDPKPSPAKEKADASEQFFAQDPVLRLQIELAPGEVKALNHDNRKYVHATVREGETVYPDVAIHLKGAAGSFRPLEDKPALTLNFDKFKHGQKFHGLDKIHLNNSVQDPSYLTENICGALFRAAGVPAPRVAYARVRLNGRDLGFYVLIEGFDKTFLRRYFKNPNGNLYDGGFLKEITDGLQLSSGANARDQSDLRKVATAAREPDPVKRLQRLDQVLDLDRFISFIVMEAMTWHWDGYAMKKNNYRIYVDPDTHKAVFLPHGMDQMFWEANGPLLPGMDGLIARAVVETPEGRRRYLERMSALLTNVFNAQLLTDRVNELAAKIRPALAETNPGEARAYEQTVAQLRRQIAQRAHHLETELARPPMPLKFDSAGVARLTGWKARVDSGAPTLNQSTEQNERRALRIHAGTGGNCVASWRAKVLLEPGQYRFEGRLRTAGVRADGNSGADLRISGQAPRDKLTGDSPWKSSGFDFNVDGSMTEAELVCELRAARGEAWFEVESLTLVRRNQR